MPLPLRKRTVHFYEIHMQARTKTPIRRPSTASLPTLLKSFQGLAIGKNLPITVGGSTKVRTTLVDWYYDANSDHYELLLNRADAGVSDVALRDFDTSNLRKAGKTKKEGIEVSAHVIVRPNRDGQTALVLLTMGAGIGPGNLERLFRGLARQASAQKINQHLFSFDNPSGAKDAKGMPMQYKVQYGFAVHGHQGQTLKQALGAGQFESMELIAFDQQQFDAGGTFQTQERTLKVEAALPKAVTSAAIVNAVKGYLKGPNAQGFDRLRVRYKTQTGKSSSTTLAINDLDAAFTLKENIDFDVDVQEQQAALNSTILKEMRPLLDMVPR
jgi:hypothetical protein